MKTLNHKCRFSQFLHCIFAPDLGNLAYDSVEFFPSLSYSSAVRLLGIPHSADEVLGLLRTLGEASQGKAFNF
jgi:hypothetical protein